MGERLAVDLIVPEGLGGLGADRDHPGEPGYEGCDKFGGQGTGKKKAVKLPAADSLNKCGHHALVDAGPEGMDAVAGMPVA